MTREEIAAMIENAIRAHTTGTPHDAPPCEYFREHRSLYQWTLAGLSALALVYGVVLLGAVQWSRGEAVEAKQAAAGLGMRMAKVDSDLEYIKDGIADLRVAVRAARPTN